MQSQLLILRKENKLSQQQLATYLGISEVTYRNKELGRYPFNQDEMYSLKRLFNVPLEQIFLPRKSPIR